MSGRSMFSWCSNTILPKQIVGGTLRDVNLGQGNRRTSHVASDMMELSQMVASKAIESWTQALLKIGMISIHMKSPYLVRLYRCFLLADICFLEELAWCKEQSQPRHKIYTGSGPREASKSLTSSCYLFVLRSRRIVRWRLQDGYANENFDDYNRGYG